MKMQMIEGTAGNLTIFSLTLMTDSHVNPIIISVCHRRSGRTNCRCSYKLLLSVVKMLQLKHEDRKIIHSSGSP
jgi:hypothetical protein